MNAATISAVIHNDLTLALTLTSSRSSFDLDLWNWPWPCGKVELWPCWLESCEGHRRCRCQRHLPNKARITSCWPIFAPEQYTIRIVPDQYWWLVWRSGNGVRHINEVTLRRARLVLGLVTTFGGSTIPVFIKATQAHSACRPSLRR